MVVATHPAGKKKSPVGITRKGVVYELFFTNLPQAAFTACDVVELYLHRGAFEPVLSDEDQEIDPDRWCSHSAWGQECWQLIAKSGLEPETRTGAPVGTNAAAHHRIRSCPSGTERPGCRMSSLIRSCLWIQPTYHRHLRAKQVVSPELIFLSNPMGRFGAQQTRN